MLVKEWGVQPVELSLEKKPEGTKCTSHMCWFSYENMKGAETGKWGIPGTWRDHMRVAKKGKRRCSVTSALSTYNMVKSFLVLFTSLILLLVSSLILLRLKLIPSLRIEREELRILLHVPDILTTLCAERSCSGTCSLYRTPTHKCYNGHKLFPPQGHGFPPFGRNSQEIENNPFGRNDILDEVFYEEKHIRPWHFKRSFYRSTDGSCSGGITDSFESLPFDECVGPFGPPFPWGKFELDVNEFISDSMPAQETNSIL